MRRFLALAITATAALVAGSAVSPAQATTATTGNVVALGDSFATAQGVPGTNLQDTCLRNHQAAYPVLVAAALRLPLRFEACSGATTADVLATQIQAVDQQTRLAMLSIGGNDVGSFGFLGLCVVGDCDTPAMIELFNQRVDAYGPVLDNLLDQLASRTSSKAKIRVVLYPQLVSLLTAQGADPVCGALSLADRQVIQNAVKRLNGVIQAQVAEPRGRDIKTISEPNLGTPGGNGLCGPKPLVFGTAGVPEYAQFHPRRLLHWLWAAKVLWSLKH